MSTRKIKDKDLVKAYIGGDLNAIEILINRHKDKVFTYIMFVVKNDALAEDIFQDTFIKVINSLKRGKYNEQGVFSSWVIRIAHNLVIDHYRKAKKMQTFSNDDNEDLDIFNSQKFAEQTVEQEMVITQIAKEVRELVDLLPDEQREVVLLRHFGGLSFKEISEQTNVSINTALGRMRYALINLRRLIEERDLTLSYS